MTICILIDVEIMSKSIVPNSHEPCVAFIITKIYLLSSESKSCRSDGRGQIEALDDFLPLFLIDDFDEAASKSD